MILPWILFFIFSLAVLIFSADFFTKGAEIAGLRMGISPFIVGVTIVSIGTSLPELITSFVALINNEPGIVAANAIGSNIANILLIVGVSAAIVGTMKVERSLIDLDAPLLAISTAILLAVIWNGEVSFFEAVVLLVTYGVFFAYTVKTGVETDDEIERADKKIKKHVESSVKAKGETKQVMMSWYRIVLYLLVGAVGVYFGASWTILSVTNIAEFFGVATSVIAITAIAFGTSLPELVVSLTAARKGNYEIALGNVYGSNIFNGLVVIGLPGLFQRLPVNNGTFQVGIFFLVAATVLYILSGISKHLHRWEGLMYLALYVLFVAKIFEGVL